MSIIYQTISLICIVCAVVKIHIYLKQQNEINNYLKQLTEQIKSTNKNSADLEEKLSNFLSTQLNTQASILQIISKINEKGILDDSTKKIFVNLNKGIQELIAKNKK